MPQDEKPAADTEKRYEVTPDVAREFNLAMQAQREWEARRRATPSGPSAEDEIADTMELRHPVLLALRPMGSLSSNSERLTIRLSGPLSTKYAKRLLNSGLLTPGDFLPTTSETGPETESNVEK